MKKLLRILLIPCLLWGLISWGVVLALAQGARGAGVRYFPETGHNVQGAFLAFFERYGGDRILGLPRTEEFVQDGLTVQYFQRARMEYYPLNPQPYQVQLSLLGDLLGYRTPPIPHSNIPAPDHPQRRYYPQTGHTLSYGFLQYFDSHGSLDVFGYPITELLMESGGVVQYFQRAKMEWHPENPILYQVTLSNLGDEYITRINLSPSVLARVPLMTQPSSDLAPGEPPPTTGWDSGRQTSPTPTPLPVIATTDLSASAWVKYPITGQGGSQTVYVRATDVWGQGVRDAAVEIIAHFRSGDRALRAPSTDASGHSLLTFGIGYPPPGYTVIIEVRVTCSGRTATTQTSFIAWW